MLVRVLILFAAVGCGTPSAPTPTPSGPAPTPPVQTPPSASDAAIATSISEPTVDAGAVDAPLPQGPEVLFVAELIELAATDRDALATHVDEDTAEELGDGALAAVLTALPAGCDRLLTLEPGYNAIAVPPPFTDDPPQLVRLKERLIAKLVESVEVHGRCADAPDGDIIMLFAVSLWPAGTSWRVLGWRDFLRERECLHGACY